MQNMLVLPIVNVGLCRDRDDLEPQFVDLSYRVEAWQPISSKDRSDEDEDLNILFGKLAAWSV